MRSTQEMKNLYIKLLLLFIANSFFAQTTVEIMPIDVKQSSEIYVKKGDILKITSAGEWTLWDKYKKTGGEGHPIEAKPYGNWGALLGQIGSGKTFFIGQTTEITAEDDGVLFLYPNYGSFQIENASGSLAITVTGGTPLKDFLTTIIDSSSTYTFDPLSGTLVTDLYFEAGQKAVIYAFGNWTMWDKEYPKVNADGHKFIANGDSWGKLYAAAGNSTGIYYDPYAAGQKSEITFKEGGFLSFYPRIENYQATKNGELKIFVQGGLKVNETNLADLKAKSDKILNDKIIAYINTKRVSAGLQPVAFSENLSKSALGHAKYMITNNVFSRDEEQGKPEFFGATPDDRAKTAGYTGGKIREMYCQAEKYQFAIDYLLNTVYHRLRLLDPKIKEIGYGAYRINDNTIHVFDIGYDDTLTAQNEFITFPGNLSADNEIQFSGMESPSPLPETLKGPTGTPISIIFNKDIEKIETVELTNSDTGEILKTHIIDSNNDVNKRTINGAIILPIDKLTPSTNYVATVRVIFKGTTDVKEIKWTFKTKQQ